MLIHAVAMRNSLTATDTELKLEDSIAVSIFTSSRDKVSLFTARQPDP